jgi:hypothetical protein
MLFRYISRKQNIGNCQIAEKYQKKNTINANYIREYVIYCDVWNVIFVTHFQQIEENCPCPTDM